MLLILGRLVTSEHTLCLPVSLVMFYSLSVLITKKKNFLIPFTLLFILYLSVIFPLYLLIIIILSYLPFYDLGHS